MDMHKSMGKPSECISMVAPVSGVKINKKARKALTSGIFMAIGAVLLLLAYSQSILYQPGIIVSIPVYLLIFGPLGILMIIIGLAYWFYIWPDECPSVKTETDDDLAIVIDKDRESAQSRDLKNITQAGFYHGLEDRGYFGGVDRRPNPPKEK